MCSAVFRVRTEAVPVPLTCRSFFILLHEHDRQAPEKKRKEKASKADGRKLMDEIIWKDDSDDKKEKLAVMMKIVTEMMSQRNADLFNVPVDLSTAPEYLDVSMIHHRQRLSFELSSTSGCTETTGLWNHKKTRRKL